MNTEGNSTVDYSAMTIGERLSAIRRHFKCTQDEFGEKLKGNGEKIDKGTISKYEKDKLEIAAKVKVELYSTLNVGKEWLETGRGKMFNNETSLKDKGQNTQENEPKGSKDEEISNNPLIYGVNDEKDTISSQSTKNQMDMEFTKELMRHIMRQNENYQEILKTFAKKLPDADAGVIESMPARTGTGSKS